MNTLILPLALGTVLSGAVVAFATDSRNKGGLARPKAAPVSEPASKNTGQRNKRC